MPLFTPTTAFKEASHLHHYQQWLEEHKNLSFADYAALWQWSTDQPAAFWESCWEYFDIIGHSPYTTVMEGTMPDTQWFTGATLNYAEHIFRHRNNERPALIFQNENERRYVSWAELESQVLAVQTYLKQQGIRAGDCVAGYLPNIPEAIVAFLAVNSLGAVWSCCSPDFGVSTVIERFAQIEPTILVTCDGYQYNQKPYDRMGEVAQIRAGLSHLRHTVFVPYLDQEASLPNSDHWANITQAVGNEEELRFTPVPFAHPIWVLYSSGTTGRPKAITHSHGGVLLEHLKYMAFHNDVKAGENFFWFTTTGWMMWNFLQASLLMGATPVLFDGSPAYPELDALWKMAEELPVHHFGTSAPYLTACMQRGLTLVQAFDLAAMRSIGSTGAPLPPEAFDWVYESVGKHIWLCSMSGGTDVCTAFVGGNPLLTVHQGRIQSRALGCALYAYDEAGQRLENSLGEMVIEQAMPSMPIYFWNDPGKERYRNSYFTEYPSKWRHGDWIKLFPDGSLIIQGRSDATLNRKGIRIGTAEIYRVLDQIPTIRESLILNLEQADGNDIMPLFVALQEGEELSPALVKTIKENLRVQCSPRHVPDVIHLAPDIPYTLSGKKMEVPVKKILLGMDISTSLNRDAVRNPEALDWFMSFKSLY
ncbi:MAG: acetoacetate--CoA ligase [Bacteroidota bacterium]